MDAPERVSVEFNAVGFPLGIWVGGRGQDCTTYIRADLAAPVQDTRPVHSQPVRYCPICDIADCASHRPAALEPAPDLAELLEALRCAVDDYEAHNGRIVSDTDPHWSVSARAALAKIKEPQHG